MAAKRARLALLVLPQRKTAEARGALAGSEFQACALNALQKFPKVKSGLSLWIPHSGSQRQLWALCTQASMESVRSYKRLLNLSWTVSRVVFVHACALLCAVLTCLARLEILFWGAVDNQLFGMAGLWMQHDEPTETDS